MWSHFQCELWYKHFFIFICGYSAYYLISRSFFRQCKYVSTSYTSKCAVNSTPGPWSETTFAFLYRHSILIDNNIYYWSLFKVVDVSKEL